jgi:hypothetical protein
MIQRLAELKEEQGKIDEAADFMQEVISGAPRRLLQLPPLISSVGSPSCSSSHHPFFFLLRFRRPRWGSGGDGD